MNTIMVKPHPDLLAAAVKALKSETDVGLLDAVGNVPEAGMPWPNGGLTLRLLTEGAILRADDPLFAERAAAVEKAGAETAAAERPADPAPEPDPAH